LPYRLSGCFARTFVANRDQQNNCCDVGRWADFVAKVVGDLGER
jgi:hypothetical protein